jgi:hypothetical protein
LVFFFITTFPAAGLGGPKTELPGSPHFHVLAFFLGWMTLYIHKVMINIFITVHRLAKSNVLQTT